MKVLHHSNKKLSFPPTLYTETKELIICDELFHLLYPSIVTPVNIDKFPVIFSPTRKNKPAALPLIQ